jgi:hypothetical protein
MDRYCSGKKKYGSGHKSARFIGRTRLFRDFLNFLFSSVFLFALFITPTAYGVFGDDLTPTEKERTESSSFQGQKTARDGFYNALEFNPADLLLERIRISGEYVIVDGFSFGGVWEGQKQETESWRHTTVGLGVTASQYFLSQTLNGPFLRGELGGFGSVFRLNEEDAVDKAVYGINLGLDLGYRMNFGKRFTSHAAYGVRRSVPDFFGTQGRGAMKEYESRTKYWSMRVLIALGFSL